MRTTLIDRELNGSPFETESNDGLPDVNLGGPAIAYHTMLKSMFQWLLFFIFQSSRRVELKIEN